MEDSSFEVVTSRATSFGAWAWIRQGLRAAALRRVTHVPDGPAAWPMLFIVVACTLINGAVSRFEVIGSARFDLQIWLRGWASVALLLFGVWFLLAKSRERSTHASPAAAWFLLFTIAMLPVGVIGIAISALAMRGYLTDWWTQSSWAAWALYVLLWLWLLVATWRVSQAVTRSTSTLASLLLFVFIVQSASSLYLYVPYWQSTESTEDEEAVAAFELSQETFEDQQVLLDDALSALKPSVRAEPQVFGLIYAPYDEDVFLRESAMVQQVLENRFGAKGRVVRLVNNSASAAQLPWATTLNLERSLTALARTMNKERDVLVIYLTSHGGADFKLAAELWPLTVETLTARQLRGMLDELGIRHRVIAVSACYSGGWIEPLRSENTLVMTAADADHTSFGCGSRSELTFFGRAVFDEQLRKTMSFEAAFNAAVPIIRQREIDAGKDDGFSNPQIAVGSRIRPVLDALSKRH